jgi:hypothetical protein
MRQVLPEATISLHHAVIPDPNKLMKNSTTADEGMTPNANVPS